jgi:hypothetical protein
VTAEPAGVMTEPKKQLKKRSRKAEIVMPAPQGLRVPKAVRRL